MLSMDRFIFLCQFTDGYNKQESVMAVKSFPNNTAVKAELLFNIISKEACSNYLSQVCSGKADTTSPNTGKKPGVN